MICVSCRQAMTDFNVLRQRENRIEWREPERPPSVAAARTIISRCLTATRPPSSSRHHSPSQLRKRPPETVSLPPPVGCARHASANGHLDPFEVNAERRQSGLFAAS